jgi:hypothetical protein
MRSYDEIYTTARDERPFSNGTEGYGWMENWCWAPCQNPAETAWQRYEEGKRKTPPKDFPGGCPLILCALNGRTPTEWIDTWDGEGPYPLGDRFHCIEFRGPDGGGGDDPFDGPPASPPRAKREPKNMDGLFERPERRRRMLKQREETDVPVHAV